MKKKYDITVAGHICLDIIPEIPETGLTKVAELLKPGHLINVGAAKISGGGPVSNTGIGLTKLGLKTALMARIGKDQFGGFIKNILKEYQFFDEISQSALDRTSYTIAIAPPVIDRIYLHDPGANDLFSSADIKKSIVSQSRLFYFGYPPVMAATYKDEGDELLRIFQIAKSVGATTALDMTIPDSNSLSGKAPWRKILAKVLPFVDIFLPSIEEIFYMLDLKGYLKVKEKAENNEAIDFIQPTIYSDLADEIMDLGCNNLVIKTGFRGIFQRTKDLKKSKNNGTLVPGDIENWSNREVWCPALKVAKIASATGSGDSAVAGFLTAYLKGCSIERTLKYANCLGFQNLQELDGVSGIRNWEQTTEMVSSENMEMIDIPQLKPAGWKWDDKTGLWVGPGDKWYDDIYLNKS